MWFYAGRAIVAAHSTFTHSFIDEQHSSGRRTKFATTVYFPTPFEALRNTCLGGNADFSTILLPLGVRICVWLGSGGFRESVHSSSRWRRAFEDSHGRHEERRSPPSLPRHASHV
jgi:hypothetical protein